MHGLTPCQQYLHVRCVLLLPFILNLAAKKSCSQACHTPCAWTPFSLVGNIAVGAAGLAAKGLRLLLCLSVAACLQAGSEAPLHYVWHLSVHCYTWCTLATRDCEPTDCRMFAAQQQHPSLLLLSMCAALLCLHASHYCFATGMCFAGGLVIVFNKQQAYLLGALLVRCRAESDCLYDLCPALHTQVDTCAQSVAICFMA
jgi:hypothetical protein